MAPTRVEPVSQNEFPAKRLLVTLDGNLYDVTDFVKDHPGGVEIITQHRGKDITQIFRDSSSHKHSGFALKLLQKYQLGKRVSKDEETEFLDLSKPLLSQLVRSKISKEVYLKEVHKPRHLSTSAILFESPYLEIFTKTPWWVIPIIWIPVVMVSFNLGSNEFDWITSALIFTLGVFTWTILEYVFHRFLFHMETMLPDHPWALTVHFLLHGIHHFLPMDQYRLVMPPIMFGGLASLVLLTVGRLIPWHFRCVLASGAICGYICYDLLHYYFHHGSPWGSYIRMMKKYHMDHHYIDPNLGYGVSNFLWDFVFGSALPIKSE